MQSNRRPPMGRNQRKENWLLRQFRRRPKPLWMVAVAHVAVLGIALLIYALPHHVIPSAGEAVGIVSVRGGAGVQTAAAPIASAAPVAPVAPVAPETTAEPAVQAVVAEPTPEPTPEATAAPVGYFRDKFADHFSADGSVANSGGVYRSGNVEISVSEQYDSALTVRYQVADIYISDISCLTTAFAKNKYGNGYREWAYEIGQRHGSIITLSGDYYGARDNGIVIRNGTLYRNDKNVNDVCVLYWDGTMRTFSPYEFNAELEMSNGAYQCWNFGPELLDDNGVAFTSFNSTVNKANPRSVIGYFEPGHYCFVTVDGRSKSSKGMTMQELAKLMENLGCKAAFNLDGGQSAMMCAGTTVLNNPYSGGREVSDVIMILDIASQM